MPLSLRQTQILAIARADGRVEVDTLADRYDVTPQTIRRDLHALHQAGEMERVHGGALLASGVTHIAYDARRSLNAAEKERIALSTAAQIPDDSSLFLNIGTTAEAVARALSGHRNLLVVTNNLNVAQTLTRAPQVEVIVTGGTLRAEDGGLVGDLAAEAVARFKLDCAVIGASALDPSGDLLDFDLQEVQVSHQMLLQSRRSMLVADSSKLQRTAPVRIASLSGLDQIITDSGLPGPLTSNCRDWGTRITVA